MDLDEKNRDKSRNLTFTRRYLDPNRVTYEVSDCQCRTAIRFINDHKIKFHTTHNNFTFDTPHGKNITAGMTQLASRFDLSFQFGTAPHDFLLTR